MKLLTIFFLACNGELKCCALNACEHGSLCVCVCARQRARRYWDSEEASIGMCCFSCLVMRSCFIISSVVCWAAA